MLKQDSDSLLSETKFSYSRLMMTNAYRLLLMVYSQGVWLKKSDNYPSNYQAAEPSSELHLNIFNNFSFMSMIFIISSS